MADMASLAIAHRSVDTVSLLREPQDIVAALPADDAVAAARQIADALRAINGADALTLEERYDDICMLDAAVVEQTGALLREYLDTARHLKQRESDIWNAAHQCWRELATAYVLCVQHHNRDTRAAAGFKQPARVAAARAMRALRRQLQWLRLRYARPTPVVWVGLAELYAQLEPDNADEALFVYPGERTTFKQELLKALVLAVLPSENLRPPQQDLATYLVGRFASSFVLSNAPAAGCTHRFDLENAQAPAAIEGAPPVTPGRAAVRYFGPGDAHLAVEAVLSKLNATGVAPAELGFKQPVDPALLRPVLEQLAYDWRGHTQERRSAERRAAMMRVTVVPGLKAIYDALEQAQADPFNFIDRPEGESWIIEDVSAEGFGVVMPPVIGDWVTVGSVAAIEGDAAGVWSVGMVRRMRRLDDGQQHIGVEVLSRNAIAVRLMVEVAQPKDMRITQRMPVDRAILLTENAVQKNEIELLVSEAAPYRENELHVQVEDAVLRVSYLRVVEANDFCTRVCMTVHGVET